ncbi:MAG: T9SS type A sorting domain-containing protein, partial [Chitinophagaceae bacterium]
MRSPRVPMLLVDKDGDFIVSGAYWCFPNDWLGGHTNDDAWVMKMADEDGGPLEWAVAYGGSSWDYLTDMSFGRSGELLLMGTSNSSGIGAGPQGDMWYMQLRSLWNRVKGNAFIDANSNGVKDLGEPNANNFSVRSESVFPYFYLNPVYETLTRNGRFRIPASKGPATNKIYVRLKNAYYNVIPASREFIFNDYEQVDSVDFALQPVQNVRDYNVNIIPLSPARAVVPVKYVLQVHNAGTDILTNREVVFIKDRMSLLSASIPPASITGDTLRWTIPLLNPTDTIGIALTMRLNTPPLSLGNLLVLKASIDSAGDVSSSDNFFALKQVVAGSYDPNDKTESSGAYITRDEVSAAKALNYIIRFQNTGTDTAFNVMILDTLDVKLNPESFEITGASHRYSVNIVNGNQLRFRFINIMLPDSNVNEPASHGYVSYRVKVKTTLRVGDEIRNTASIYFDLNPEIRTNTYKTSVVDNAALPIHLNTFQGVRNNNIINLTWKASGTEAGDVFEIERSINGTDFEKIGSVNVSRITNNSGYAFDDNLPVNGLNYYRLKMLSVDGSVTYSRIIVIEFGKNTELYLTVHPNPASGKKIFIKIEGKVNDVCKIDVLDVNGRKLLTKNIGIVTSSQYITELSTGKLQRGLYMIRLTTGDKIIIRKITIM